MNKHHFALHAKKVYPSLLKKFSTYDNFNKESNLKLKGDA